MISTDLHTHTLHSHGSSSVFDMFMAGQAKGLKIHGFSEHSPRPLGYDFTNEYREHLTKSFPTYVKEVQEIAKTDACQVLLGMELDWIENEVPFMEKCAQSYPFDYLIAGIHFIDTWGFDDRQEDWDKLSEPEKFHFYTAYYKTMIHMAKSNLFNILAHPDLIKIFSVDSFHAWLPHNKPLVKEALMAVKEANMCMEVSSAGLRKPCAEIYPCRSIMEIAKEINIPISFASDGHCVNTIGFNFEALATYAKEYGYSESVYFVKKEMHRVSF